ncbi:MAG: hypothetical protein ACYTDV_15960, partial [Planctomycetota bacterium]
MVTGVLWRRHRGIVVLILLLMAPRGTRAIELWSDEQGRKGELAVTGKTTFLASDAPSDPVLFPEDNSETTLARLRLGLEVTHCDWMDSELAYEQRAQWLSGATALGAGSSFLPSQARAAFRLAQLDWEIAADDSFTYRHEMDRALVALHPAWGDVTVGRQAIGLGRG